ncbi:MlaE family lipid ABC transporter permease subunit [Immundisolibacter sp.]|uniref:ABC transporter permease n=1 Tax=Immundisolibacter sp. TaxID=1934948 RepID=UPI0026189310|nr:MlaE family lipid ABC transporter permease subunit [Immundisolibacter sp.]MDD3651087.1 MlaE family lipid ABC transporter permease subunit [Immundisolibacter sp.]
MPSPATLVPDPANRTLHAAGDWTVCSLDAVQAQWRDWQHAGDWTLDAGGIDGLDTAGAWALHRLTEAAARAGVRLDLRGLASAHAALLELVRARLPKGDAEPAAAPGWLERLGRGVVAHVTEVQRFLDFVGRLVAEQRRRLRWTRLVQEIDAAGVSALPILGLLAFLMGVVVTYQAGEPLKAFGANVLVVNLVGVTMLREMGPLLAAIIVAGRTGSAYTAEIGTMRITEELDALRSIGIAPMEMLVVPKLLGLTVALPLLTLYASMMGILGGMVVADGLYGVGYVDFLRRLPNTFSPSTFWVGLIKAPVFALIVAAVACHRGFQVGYSAESIGRETTTSVVQSIFLVIIADAAFSVVFQVLGL